MSSCTGTQKKETLTNCVITPCMVMKTKGIPSCTGTPGQPLKFNVQDISIQDEKGLSSSLNQNSLQILLNLLKMQ